MNQGYPQGGLAALLASKGRKGDSVLVHMTPGEVEGLQALALATGGSLTTNPKTGLPEANWLKSLLPAIAGSTLKTLFPKLGSAATGLIVGGISGLVDKSFDKGLRSGLSAYSGSKTIEGLQAARQAVRPVGTPRIISGEDEVSAARLRDTRTPIDLSKIQVDTTPVQTVTKAPSLFGEGVRALFKPEGQEAFLKTIEGPYERQGMRDLSRAAYFSGLANIFAQEPKKIKAGTGSSGTRFYVPGEVNPLYGQGYDQWYFKPGYFSDKYPGYAGGGIIPRTNFSFPTARVNNKNYEPNVDTYSGEETFADGGEVMVSPRAVLPDKVTVYNPTFTQDRAGLKSYYESLLTPPGPPRDTSAVQAYLDDLRARLKRPYQPFTTTTDTQPTTPTTPDKPTLPITPPTSPVRPPIGTPIEFVNPKPKEPEKDVPKEELTPPSYVAPNPRPVINIPYPDYVNTEPDSTITVTPIEELIVPDVPREEMYLPDIDIPFPDYVNLTPEPERETEISVTPIEDLIVPDFTEQDLYRPVIDVPFPDYLNLTPEPEKETEISVTPIEELIVPDLTLEDMYQPDINQVLQDVRFPDYLNLTSEPERTGSVSYRENPYGYDFVELGFINPQTTQEVADASKPIVDEILKNFEAQQKAEKEAQIEKAKEIVKDVGLAAAKALIPGLDVTLEIWKAIQEQKEKEAPKEKEATVKVEEVPDQPVEQPPTTSAPAGGGSAIPWTSGQNYTLRDLKTPFGTVVESEEGYEPDYSVEVQEVGMAGGGMIPRFSQGGIGSLQQYAVGGKLLNGAGDGMSDDIKANINGTQEARLADGEFVIPADVVSHLGNGSTDAGAKQLYAMMDRIRKARTGRNRQAPEVKARKYMPA